MSIGPIVMVITQPIWRMICDWTGRARTVLVTALLATGGIGLVFLFIDGYLPLLAAAASLALFQGAIIPISDTLTVNYAMQHRLDYGSFRLWGAIGFAVAGFAMGWLAERFGLSVIFYGFALTLWLGAASARRMPEDRVSLRVDLRSGLEPFDPVCPVLSCFFWPPSWCSADFRQQHLYGPPLPVLRSDGGRGRAGVLAGRRQRSALHENRGSWIRRRGALAVTLFAAGISALRWLFYFFEPDILWLYLTSVVQGLSTGLFIPGRPDICAESGAGRGKNHRRLPLHGGGNRPGKLVLHLVGGWILETFDIFTTYLFFGILTESGR